VTENPFPPHCVTRLPLRVRFFETDLMGIVHHAAYLTYVEAGRVEYLRRRGADYRAMMDRGFHMPVVEAHLEYRRAARFDEELVVETRLGALTRVTVRFDYDVFRGDELVVSGHTLLACVDDKHKPRRIPPDIAELLRKAELASSSRFTEPSEASRGPGGTEGPP
jgi:acyl-CoA thioester hydrolase